MRGWRTEDSGGSRTAAPSDTDGNRGQTEAYYKAAKKDGFRHVTYIQVPGMGHTIPDGEWFEKGIVALDEGRNAAAEAGAKGGAGRVEKTVEKPDAQPAAKVDEIPTPPEARQDDAGKLIKMARLYADNRLYGKAREKLTELLNNHPDSPHAAEAQTLLKELGK